MWKAKIPNLELILHFLFIRDVLSEGLRSCEENEVKDRKDAQRQQSPDVQYDQPDTEALIREFLQFGTNFAMDLKRTVEWVVYPN